MLKSIITLFSIFIIVGIGLAFAGTPLDNSIGNVVGPASGTDNAIVRFDTTSGNLLQDSGVLINDSDDITTAGQLINSGTTVIDPGGEETGVTAVYHSDGTTTTATLTLTNVVLTVGSSENLGVGVLIFTLPAGNLTVIASAMSLAISGVSTTTDTPDVGLGTIIASGVVTVLGGTPTFENIQTGVAADDTNGTAEIAQTPGVGLAILTGDAHTVHFNAADAWGANADASGLVNGTVVLTYRFNFA